MPRRTFLQIFKLLDANTIQVLRKIKLGRLEFDEGTEINRGVIVAGIDLFNYVDADFEGTEIEGGTFDIKRIYPHG